MENHRSCSHDFIGEFTTSYRELARGQSHFNVYEVRGEGCMGGGVLQPPVGVTVPLLHSQGLRSPESLCCTPVCWLWGTNTALLGCYGPQGPSLCCTSGCQGPCGCYIPQGPHDAILGCYGPQGPSQLCTLVCHIPKGPPPAL